MKRKLGAVLLVLALVLSFGLVPALPVVAHTELCPQVVTLYAGQDIDVGNVSVWNDATNLYIKYETTGDWVMTETHLHVAKDVGDIPQTEAKEKGKNIGGNPIPGHFAYSEEHDPAVTEYTYTIPLNGWVPGDNPLIAAHAVVHKVQVDSYSDTLVSGADSDDVLLLVEGASGYPIGYTASYQTYSGTIFPAVLAWTHSAWAPYGIAGAEWISSAEYAENPDNNTWRLFTRSFELPAGATNILGTLVVNCDNAEEVYLNETFVGDGSPAVVYGESPASGGGRHGYDSVEGPLDVSSELQAGTNDLWTMTRNYGWAGGSEANPTALIYKLYYTYDVVTTQTESAWGEGTRFVEKGNWSTYFTYTVGELLTLHEKDSSTWEIVPDGAFGELWYNESGPTFDFSFSATGLKQNNTSYSLIYYADLWPGDNPGALIATGTSDGSGNLTMSGSEDLGMDLPDSSDANYLGGAKIWLVPSADYDDANTKMVGWNPGEYLFEHHLITYDDTDV